MPVRFVYLLIVTCILAYLGKVFLLNVVRVSKYKFIMEWQHLV